MNQKPLKIITIADLTWQNGLEYSLDGINIARNSGVDLVYEIIGKGPMLEALGYTIHELGLEDCCRIKPRRRWSYHPDVFLIPAITSGFNFDNYLKLSNIEWITTYNHPRLKNIHLIPRWDSQSIADEIKKIANRSIDN